MSDKAALHILEMMSAMGHEQLMFCCDEASGYRGVIAIHSTKLGPAVGGTRFWNYASEDEARRVEIVPRDDLQMRGRRGASWWREVDHHRRQQDS
jgi:hypothetical protein